MESKDRAEWNGFVDTHPHGSVYHLAEWKEVIEQTYGHSTYYLLGECSCNESGQESNASVCGILPLVHIKHFLFGNTLVSMPFLDYGGLLAENPEVESALIREAAAIGGRLGAACIELRQTVHLKGLETGSNEQTNPAQRAVTANSNKVRMVLDLPASSDDLLRSFKAKLRSQVNRPIKDGLKYSIGGAEFLDDFYTIWLKNMRDLGSPAHSKKLFLSILQSFEPLTRVCVVHKDGVPSAASLIIRSKNQMLNPWASSLREYSKLNPNMLLYWAMLEYSCECGCSSFDFGRSSPDAGTYRFKEQWGAKPQALYWHYIPLKPGRLRVGSHVSKRGAAEDIWRRLPVSLTAVLGPRVRKYISL
ncbi:MAG: FemAB family XrtA/PEP-CTERM system-associated protein [Syntrophobacteraceae bacterium]